MTKFSKVFSAEFGKSLNAKSFKILIVLILISIIIIGVAFTVISKVDTNQLNQLLESEALIEDVDIGLQTYKRTLEEYQALKKDGKIKFSPLDKTEYMLKSRVAIYEYMKENKLTFKDVNIYTETQLLMQNRSAIGFLRMLFDAILTIIVLYAIVLSASSIWGEKKDGTLKFALLRPVSRSTLFTAKYLSIFATSMIALLFALIVGSIYSMIFYDLTAKPILMVFNATSVFKSSAFGLLVGELIFGIITLFFMIQFSYFLCNIFQNKIGSVALIVLVLAKELIIQLTAIIYVGYAGFFSNFKLMGFFGLNGGYLAKQNFFASVFVICFYVTAFIVVNYLTFEKRDIK